LDVKGLCWICTECGYTSDRRFSEDICPKCGMTYWMCDECGFTTIAALPPEFCPECCQPCNFNNLTCYIPELGSPEIYDMLPNPINALTALYSGSATSSLTKV
jgi:hypothetical protein